MKASQGNENCMDLSKFVGWSLDDVLKRLLLLGKIPQCAFFKIIITFDKHGGIKASFVNCGADQIDGRRTDINYIKEIIRNNRHSYSDDTATAILAIADSDDRQEKWVLFELSGKNATRIWFKDMRPDFSTGLLPMLYGAKGKKLLSRLTCALRDKISTLWA